MSAAAIQRPSMGSSRPPNGNAPFGYSFDGMYPEPATPPLNDRLGAPLLNDSDNRMLDLFFEGMTNGYNSYGEGLGDSEQWISQLPPAYLGHMSSFGQEPSQIPAPSMQQLPVATYQDMLGFVQTMMPPPPQPSHQHHQHQQHHLQAPPQPPPPPAPAPPALPVSPSPHQQQHNHRHLHYHSNPHTPVEQSTYTDAAAVLASFQSPHSNSHPPLASNFNRGQNLSAHSFGNGFDQTRPLRTPQFSPAQIGPTGPPQTNDHTPLFPEIMLENTPGRGKERQVETPSLQWGSDANFVKAQPFADKQHESHEQLEQRRMGFISKALRINTSATPTRASSPQHSGERSTPARCRSSMNDHAKDDADHEAPPKKRRKSKATEETEEQGNGSTSFVSKAPTRKRRSKTDLKGNPEALSPAPDAHGKRRKSTINEAKASRENLTDAQKRQNHIRSEQRRRGAIKDGFDGLMFIIPGLNAGSYSKSTVLSMTVSWLEDLVKGNDELELGYNMRERARR
ncbi:hypothetical protein F4778DRAFT_583037 [Xylariomycetidae sp. FL2044]|nr:hypothetical protein F4778DRAFT_583037 [Xylariomycetidae sp. FL2044]